MRVCIIIKRYIRSPRVVFRSYFEAGPFASALRTDDLFEGNFKLLPYEELIFSRYYHMCIRYDVASIIAFCEEKKFLNALVWNLKWRSIKINLYRSCCITRVFQF